MDPFTIASATLAGLLGVAAGPLADALVTWATADTHGDSAPSGNPADAGHAADDDVTDEPPAADAQGDTDTVPQPLAVDRDLAPLDEDLTAPTHPPATSAARATRRAATTHRHWDRRRPVVDGVRFWLESGGGNLPGPIPGPDPDPPSPSASPPAAGTADADTTADTAVPPDPAATGDSDQPEAASLSATTDMSAAAATPATPDHPVDPADLAGQNHDSVGQPQVDELDVFDPVDAVDEVDEGSVDEDCDALADADLDALQQQVSDPTGLADPDPDGGATGTTAPAAPAPLPRPSPVEPDAPSDRLPRALPDQAPQEQGRRRQWWRPSRSWRLGAAVGALWSLLTLHFLPEHPAALPGYFLVAFVCVVLSEIDLRTRLLPNRITGPAFAGTVLLLGGAAVVAGEPGRITRALVAALLAGLLFLVFAWLGGMGMGDVKFAPTLAVALGWLSWTAVATGMMLAFIIAGVAATVAMTVLRWGRKATIPLGPWLAAGVLLAILTERV